MMATIRATSLRFIVRKPSLSFYAQPFTWRSRARAGVSSSPIIAQPLRKFKDKSSFFDNFFVSILFIERMFYYLI